MIQSCLPQPTWLESAQKRLCGANPLTEIEAKNLSLALEIQVLKCSCPASFAQDEPSAFCTIEAVDSFNLSKILASISCGNLLESAQIENAYAKLAVRKLECCESNVIYV